MNSKSRKIIKYFSRRCLSVFFFLIVGFCMIATVGRAQIAYSSEHNTPPPRNDKGELTINKGTRVEQALKHLKNYFDVVFLYRDEFITGKKVTKTMVLSGSIDKALKELLKGQPLVYEQLSYKTYGIYLREIKSKNKIVDRQETVTGTVTNAQSGEPIPNVNIIVRGTNMGTTTNTKGVYSLQVPSLQDTLVFSFVGYESAVVPIRERTAINVQLQPTTVMAEELVVVGYGTEQKEKLTGSVSTVSAEELTNVSVANTGALLAGKVPGLITKQSTGLPGASAPNVSIRGFGNPLILVDGVQVSKNYFSNINPKNIASISVLKGASAAIYGARGGNGVILVTTKQGETSQETKISYTGRVSFQQPTVIPNHVNAARYTEMVREGQLNAGLEPRFSKEEIKKYRQGTDPAYQGYDYYDVTLKKWAPMQKHTVSVSGGSSDVTYFASGGYMHQGFLFESNDWHVRRYNARANLHAFINKNLDVTLKLSYQRQDIVRSATTKGLAQGSRQTFVQLSTAEPIYPPRLPDPTKIAYTGFGGRNPVASMSIRYSGKASKMPIK